MEFRYLAPAPALVCGLARRNLDRNGRRAGVASWRGAGGGGGCLPFYGGLLADVQTKTFLGEGTYSPSLPSHSATSRPADALNLARDLQMLSFVGDCALCMLTNPRI